MATINRRAYRLHSNLTGIGVLLALAALLLFGCTAAPAQNLAILQSKTYSAANLAQLVGADAPLYRSYAVEQVQVEELQGPDGLTINVQTWKLADTDSAYGLFTQLCRAKPLQLGNDGCSDGQRLLGFWQERYSVILRASAAPPPGLLESTARGLQSKLPQGGKRPALVDLTPSQNRSAQGLIYFHEEIALQKYLPLDGNNRLGLSAQTQGVLADYSLDGKPAQLLLLEYPDETAAASGLRALQNYGLPDLLVAGGQGRRIAAVFGSASSDAAASLLADVLR